MVTTRSSSTPSPDVLIVGAGPTGLVLALWLTRLGVKVRIVDKTVEPGTTSRALAVHARTLELYRQVGVAADVVERGLKFAGVNVWVRGELAGHAAFGDIGEGLSPFPYVLILPQDQHEKLLIEHLRRIGVTVERRTELVDFVQRDDNVTAHLQLPDGSREECNVAYIAGCDGARSRVREVMGVDFPGGTYERVFYVADVELHGKVTNHELHVALDDADFLAVFPLKGQNVARLIGTVEPASEARHDELTWDDVSPRALQRMQMQIDRVNWFSTYKVHHRVAASFRQGHAFLLGDAAHIHSPVGGQGMNTGIGDAVNLAWKLSSVIRHRAAKELLATYEPERIAFAKRLVATTDRAFTFATRDGFLARRIRLDAVPRIIPALMKRTAIRRLAFRTISQTLLDYRHGELAEGKAGSVRGGDRLPWVKPEEGVVVDNFTPLTSLQWQLHVYGEASDDLTKTCAELRLTLHVFAWTPHVAAAGLKKNAAYLVRPDGYVGLVDAAAQPEQLRNYLQSRRIVL